VGERWPSRPSIMPPQILPPRLCTFPSFSSLSRSFIQRTFPPSVPSPVLVDRFFACIVHLEPSDPTADLFTHTQLKSYVHLYSTPLAPTLLNSIKWLPSVTQLVQRSPVAPKCKGVSFKLLTTQLHKCILSSERWTGGGGSPHRTRQ